MSATGLAGVYEDDQWRRFREPRLDTPPSFFLRVGTGGDSLGAYLIYRNSTGSGFFKREADSHSVAPPSRTNSSEDLAHIRAVLKPNVTDLARALGVSRQSVYSWQSGAPVSADNAERLARLARAADILAGADFSPTAHITRRPIAEGKNLFEIVREGESAEDAARTLIKIIRRERTQRDNLRKRLATRRQPTRDDFLDLGAPMLDEDG